jgi:hypothetical protein
MSKETVRALVGPPLEEYRVPGGVAWRWARSAHDSNYRERVVVFVSNSVFEKHSEYYLD